MGLPPLFDQNSGVPRKARRSCSSVMPLPSIATQLLTPASSPPRPRYCQ
ncbi:MAG TPA: hypothetical protein VGS18_00200 [Thermoplasmata archaeon]|nr:hypothetical protein [Thermoplasmata archaeon]